MRVTCHMIEMGNARCMMQSYEDNYHTHGKPWWISWVLKCADVGDEYTMSIDEDNN